MQITNPSGPAVTRPGDVSPPDPFDPASLRITPSLAAGAGVKKLLLAVPVRRPDKAWWVRAHPGEDYRLTALVLELKEERETYLVSPQLQDALDGESSVSPRLLVTAVNRQGTVFLWPSKLPDASGKLDAWSSTMMDAVGRASGVWVRVQANMAAGHYDVWEAAANITEPQWPSETFAQLLKVAFRDRYIDSHDHPLLRQLRGEA